jgi:hypothetical protein
MTQTLLSASIEEILPHIGKGKPKKLFETPYGSFLVRMTSSRLECFRRNLACVRCGVKGNIFLLQRTQPGPPKVGINCHIENCMWCWGREIRGWNDMRAHDTPHLNLFYKAKNGALTLMTQDHIIAQARGGGWDQSNLQTMCHPCNQFKGTLLPEDVPAINRKKQ